MKIGILSDTHNMLRPEVADTLRDCDLILHAGDIAKPEILDELRQIAPVKAVRGNNDRAWAEAIPKFLDFEVEGQRFYMTHKKTDIPVHILHPEEAAPRKPLWHEEKYGGEAKDRDKAEGRHEADNGDTAEDGDLDISSPADIVIFGHSHRYEEYREGPTLFLNPGSCGPRRFTQPITMMILEIGGGETATRKVEFEHKKRQMHNTPPASDRNLIIIGAVRDIQRGFSVPELARKYNISEEFAEQICRMYLTHPGIDAQGVLDKMEIRWS